MKKINYKLTDDILRNQGNLKSEINQEYTGKIILNKTATFKAVGDYIKSKNIKSVNQYIYQKIEGDKFKKISSLKLDSRFFNHDYYNNNLIFKSASFIHLEHKQKIEFYIDKMGWSDLFFTIKKTDNIIIKYHIVLNNNGVDPLAKN